jgi:hypothetical protein
MGERARMGWLEGPIHHHLQGRGEEHLDPPPQHSVRSTAAVALEAKDCAAQPIRSRHKADPLFCAENPAAQDPLHREPQTVPIVPLKGLDRNRRARARAELT